MKDFLYKMYFLQLWEEVNPWQLSVPFKIIGLVPFSWFSLNRLFTLSRLSNGHRIFFFKFTVFYMKLLVLFLFWCYELVCLLCSEFYFQFFPIFLNLDHLIHTVCKFDKFVFYLLLFHVSWGCKNFIRQIIIPGFDFLRLYPEITATCILLTKDWCSSIQGMSSSYVESSFRKDQRVTNEAPRHEVTPD